MESVKFFSTSTCEYLFNDIENNLEWYFGSIKAREPKGMSLPENIKKSLQVRKKNYSEELYEIVASCDKPADSDIEASLLVYDSLCSINKEQSTSARLWIYENHQNRRYISSRWMKSSSEDKDSLEKAKKKIAKHYFNSSPRAMLRTNATARLWHNGYYANSIDPENPKRFMEIVIKPTDMRANIIERPGISRNLKIMSALYNVLLDHQENHESVLLERSNYREWLKQINAIGGVKLLDAMDETHLIKLFSSEADKILYL